MSWNNGGGPSPWGNPGNTPPRKPNQPNRGPWGGSQGVPDMDEMLERIQAGVRRVLPGGPGGRRGGPQANGRLLGLIGLVALVAWLASGFYRVQPDQEGVVLRFGAFVGKTAPGLNYHIPWPIETALTPATTLINRIEVGYRGAPDTNRTFPGGDPGRDGNRAAARDVPQEALMLTGDENIIDINLSVFWRIRDAGAFLFNTRNAEYTVKSAAESMMREVIGRTPIQPALTEARARIEEQVKSAPRASSTSTAPAWRSPRSSCRRWTRPTPSSRASATSSAPTPTPRPPATRPRASATTSCPAPAATPPA